MNYSQEHMPMFCRPTVVDATPSGWRSAECIVAQLDETALVIGPKGYIENLKEEFPKPTYITPQMLQRHAPVRRGSEPHKFRTVYLLVVVRNHLEYESGTKTMKAIKSQLHDANYVIWRPMP